MTWAEDESIVSTVNASKVDVSPTTWSNEDGSVTWTVTVDGGALKQNVTNSYAQIGTKNDASSSIIMSTESFSGTISKIELDCASYNGIGSVACTVGGKPLGTQNQDIPAWSNNSGGIVTFQGSGSGKIELTMSNNRAQKPGAMYVKSITVTYINKANPDLTYSEESVTINKGEDFTAPELSMAEGFNETIVYESSNTAVATISNTGEVTIGNAAGIATITASFSGNSSWASSSASYTLTVNDPDNPMTTIIFGYGNVEINDATVTGDDSKPNAWTITTVGTTSFTNKKNDNYSQVGSSNKPATSITFTTTLPTTYPTYDITAFSANFGGFSGTTGTITLKVGDTVVGEGTLNGDKNVVVTSTLSATGNTLTVTITGIAAAVKCYSISYLAVPSVEITMNEFGLMSYASDNNLDFTGSGLKAYAVTGINGNELTMTEVTAAKAGEGLMLEGVPGNHTILLATTEPAAVSGNMLVGLTVATEVPQVDGDYTTFILANGADGVNWYMLEESYTLRANSAYLKLATDQIPASRSLTMVFGDPSGIENVNRQTVNNNQYFDLSGRRVAQPTKGLYIVNGKKVYIK